ncbi:class I SAM-dependent methyltransferase [Methylobacterium sp. J-076]|uniref:class I SAM-dependent methyltransferase n=1 Tax=Methylobacterium sp. J-076 TaxID=2836655 RepID=UPI001FB977CD|nr:class I SAM-dependent methyltransferase [Methylobacterium sp. J-076]MCJ2014567.1 class I SAM-dependent methyltransferase [Methylobacterium sp. J-076]
MTADEPIFSHTWDGRHVGISIFEIWDRIRTVTESPRKILEVGSFEGYSTSAMIRLFADRSPIEITCIDSWAGAILFDERVDPTHEARFDANVAIAVRKAENPVQLRKIKSDSFRAMASLIHEGESESFDWIYVDGSHEAKDVFLDAAGAFRLLKRGGILIFDDYLWNDPLAKGGHVNQTPKPAIDAFVKIFYDQLTVFAGAGLWQMYLRKN